MRCKKGPLAFLLFVSMLVLSGSSLTETEVVPQASRDAAQAFLQVLEKFVQGPAGHNYAFKVMKLEKLDDLAEARLGAPYRMYTISSSGLASTSLEASSFLTNATFCYYCFPLIIRDQYHGVIQVNMSEGKWTGAGYLGQEEVIDYICQLMVENGDKTEDMYSMVLLDGSYFYAFTRISGTYSLKPANKHSASLLGGDSRAIEFKDARAFLVKYVSSKTKNSRME